MAATPLVIAAQNGRVEEVRRLIEAGANVNERSPRSFNQTPLQRAAELGHTRVVDILIKAGADINVAGDYFDSTPLYMAIAHNNIETANYLIEAGANPNLLSGGSGYKRYPLTIAVEINNLELVNNLIRRGGADVNLMSADDRDGAYTALCLAVTQRKINIVRALLEAGADTTVVFPDGHKILSKCISIDDGFMGGTPNVARDIVKLLIQHGADPLERDPDAEDSLVLGNVSLEALRSILLLPEITNDQFTTIAEELELSSDFVTSLLAERAHVRRRTAVIAWSKARPPINMNGGRTRRRHRSRAKKRYSRRR